MSLSENAVPSNDPLATPTAAATAFDLDTYIGRYAYCSETQIQRLVFIAQHASADDVTKQSALTMLNHLLKESGNTVRYQQVFPGQDQEWLMTQTTSNDASLELLEARLSAAQANLNKDAIRIAHLNLGDFFYQKGQIRDALRHVLRSRDYCTNRTQTRYICWKVIELAMNAGT